jgi:hypothetical protein
VNAVSHRTCCLHIVAVAVVVVALHGGARYSVFEPSVMCCSTFEKNPKMVVFSKNFYYTQTCSKKKVNYIKINGKKFKWDDSSFGVSKSKDVSYTTDRSVP